MNHWNDTPRTKGRQKSPEQQRPPRSIEIDKRGIKNDSDFANLMSALMSDLIEGNVTPSIGNAISNAGGKLLKVVELQCKMRDLERRLSG
jgi:hypothetical protein